MNVICAIAKNEELYIKDGCNYHLNLGFDHIYIYDNSVDREHNLAQYVNDNRVTFIPRYGIHKKEFQNECYNDFYNNNKFDWCAFIDIDEYIVLNKGKNVYDFLSDPVFANYQVIRLCWHLFGDNNLIDRDRTIPVNEFFTIRSKNKVLNHTGKHIIRGGLQGVYVTSSHYSLINGKLPKQCLCNGEPTECKVNCLPDYPEVWVNHYMTKTLSEFIDTKLKRGTDAQFPDRKLDFGYYGDVNEKTREKLDYINSINKC